MADTITPEQAAAATEGIAQAGKEMAEVSQQVGKVSDAFSKLASSNVDIIKAFSNLGKETTGVFEQFGHVVEAIKETTTTIKGWKTVIDTINDSLISNSQKLANVLEQSRANYVKATGDIAGSTGTMGEAMNKASKEMTKFGVDTSNAAIAVGSLIPQVTSNLEPTIKLTATFEQLGIGTKTTAQNLNLFSDAMGISRSKTDESGEAMGKTVLALSKMNGSLTESAALIQQNTDIILIFGGDALVKLQGQALSTGIALDTLTQVSKKFDTFEGAAEQVGKLNALLGSDYLGVTEMMYAEPADQVQMIANAFRDAGASIEDMDPIQKKFMLQTVQSTLGLKNQQEALRFLQADEFEQGRIMARNADQTERSQKIQENLNEALQKSMPALEQLSNAFSKLMSGLSPVFEKLTQLIALLADGMQYVADFSKEWPKLTFAIEASMIVFGGFISLMMSLALALTTAGASISAIGGGLATVSAGLVAAGPAAGGAAVGIGALSEVLFAVAVAMLGIGAGFALMGVGILAATYGISLLIDSLKGTSTEIITLIQLMAAFSVMLYAITPAAIMAGPALMQVGLAIGLIGAGIGAATTGLGFMMKSLTDIGTNVDIIIKLADAIDKIQGQSLKLNVEVVGDVAALQAIGKVTVAATSPNAPAISSATERVIVIKEVNVKIDDKKSFKASVVDMLFEDPRMQDMYRQYSRSPTGQ